MTKMTAMANEEVRREWSWGRVWCVSGDLEPPVLLCEGLSPEGSPSVEPCLFKTQCFLFHMALSLGKLFIALLFMETSRGEIRGTLVKIGCPCWDSTIWALMQEPWFSPASPWAHVMLPAKIAILFPSYTIWVENKMPKLWSWSSQLSRLAQKV